MDKKLQQEFDTLPQKYEKLKEKIKGFKDVKTFYATSDFHSIEPFFAELKTPFNNIDSKF